MIARAWSSLDDELAVAAELFGGDGSATVASWLDLQESRVSDAGFAAEFYTVVSLPGVSLDDYLHRVIRTPHGDLLGGIRFRGRNINHPFVEIIAHGFDSLDRLRACVSDEWSMFRPGCFRLCTRPGRVSGPNALLDMSIYAGRYRDMRSPRPEVRLTPFPDADAAIDLVRHRYERLAAEDHVLASNVVPAEPGDLRQWHREGQLQAVTVEGVAVGALAIAPGAIRWIEGDEIQEEIIDTAHNGHGYAALAQAAWAASVAVDRDRLLIGTIDGLNIASRKTAGRVGRRRVLDLVFVSV